jgi:DtxR family Mn-dependent transcriptional regulator
MSESAEMYLLRIALLSHDGEPVPIAQLAETLGVSPISANQMCRRLEEKELVHYQPYKGVTLTERGETVAMRVLRKRRLWEVFLSEKLGLTPEEAEDIACRLEHVTPDDLSERLAEFLGRPRFSPQRQPIPPSSVSDRRPVARPLATLAVGERAHIVGIPPDDALSAFLRGQHVTTGAEVVLLAVADNRAMLLDVNGQHISMDFTIAQKIEVAPTGALHHPEIIDVTSF